MIEADRRAFAEALNQMFSIYGDEVTNRMRDAWWGVLSPYNMDAVLAAMNLHAGDVERGMFRPTPADVRKHLEITIPEMMRSRRDKIAREARSRIAPQLERIAKLENDVRLGLLTDEQAAVKVEPIRQNIRHILSEPHVTLALAPSASLRDDEQHIAHRDRIPDVVRKAMGWLGKRRKGTP